MWALADPDLYAEVVASSNSLSISIDVIKGGQVIHPNLELIDGAITVDRSRRTRRTIDLTVAPRLSTGTYTDRPALPEVPAAPLGHYGQELRVLHSLVTPDGSLLTVPVGLFRIDDVGGSELGLTEVRVHGVSREAYVADELFWSPTTVSGPSAVAIIRQLILDCLPQALVVSTATADRGVAPTTEEQDRWGLIETLAASIGAQVYADPTGRFVIADAPTIDTDPVWTFAPADGMTLIDANRTSTRDGVYNSVTVRGATPAGATTPVSATATDDVEGSPTRWGDPDDGYYGRANLVVSHPELTTAAQCLTVARAELARKTGAASSLDLSAIPHAGLEALNVVDVLVPQQITGALTTVRRHVIDRFVLPLTPAGDFPVQTRELR